MVQKLGQCSGTFLQNTIGRKGLLFFTSFLNYHCWWFEKYLRGSRVTFRSLVLQENCYQYLLGMCSGHPRTVGYTALCHSCWCGSFFCTTHMNVCWGKAGRVVFPLQVNAVTKGDIIYLSLISKAIFNHSMKCNTVQQEWQRISHSKIPYRLGS